MGEFGFGGGAAIIGTLLSLVTSYLLSKYLTGYGFSLGPPRPVVLCVIILSVITADFGASGSLGKNPPVYWEG